MIEIKGTIPAVFRQDKESSKTEKEELIEILERAECTDGFACPFGMFGENDQGAWGCFAKYPDGDPAKPNQGCIAHQAAKMLRGEECL